MNNFMKSSIASFALLAVTSAYANKGAVYHAPAPEKIGFKDGVYVAGYAGAQWSNFNWDGQGDSSAFDEDDGVFNYEAYSLEDDNGTTEFVGAVALGYQLVNDRLYLGFEVAGTFDGTSDSEAVYFSEYDGDIYINNNVQVKASLQGSEVDLDIKPGIIFNNNFLVYARIGAAFNKLKMESSGDWYADGYDWAEAYDSDSSSKNVVGIRLGAGMEYLMSEHFGISLDYLYTDYGTVSSDMWAYDYYDADYLDFVSGSNFSETHVTTQTLMAGLLYHF